MFLTEGVKRMKEKIYIKFNVLLTSLTEGNEIGGVVVVECKIRREGRGEQRTKGSGRRHEIKRIHKL